MQFLFVGSWRFTKVRYRQRSCRSLWANYIVGYFESSSKSVWIPPLPKSLEYMLFNCNHFNQIKRVPTTIAAAMLKTCFTVFKVAHYRGRYFLDIRGLSRFQLCSCKAARELLLGSILRRAFMGSFDCVAASLREAATSLRMTDVIYSPLLPMKLMRSRTRLEYPHSLSYQEMTFTRFPTTSVHSESTIEERGSPRKSADTSSFSSYPR